MPLHSEDLDPLITECPNCHTRFRVSESQLQVAGGRVRCGACLKVFLGTDYLQWDREEIVDDRAPDETLDDVLGELEHDLFVEEPAAKDPNLEHPELVEADEWLHDDAADVDEEERFREEALVEAEGRLSEDALVDEQEFIDVEERFSEEALVEAEERLGEDALVDEQELVDVEERFSEEALVEAEERLGEDALVDEQEFIDVEERFSEEALVDEQELVDVEERFSEEALVEAEERLGEDALVDDEELIDVEERFSEDALVDEQELIDEEERTSEVALVDEEERANEGELVREEKLSDGLSSEDKELPLTAQDLLADLTQQVDQQAWVEAEIEPEMEPEPELEPGPESDLELEAYLELEEELEAETDLEAEITANLSVFDSLVAEEFAMSQAANDRGVGAAEDEIQLDDEPWLEALDVEDPAEAPLEQPEEYMDELPEELPEVLSQGVVEDWRKVQADDQASREAEPEPEPAPEPMAEMAAMVKPGESSQDDVASAADATTPAGIALPSDWALAEDAEEAIPSKRRWAWIVGAVLAVVIVIQIVYLMFPSWSKDPDARWLPQATCAVLGCELEPLRDVEQLVLNNVIVRDHAEKAGVLVVDVLFVNTASFPQAFPEIELTFNTEEGQLVAWRRFKPEEYLADPLGGKREIAEKTPVHVSVEIKDPGPGSDRYEVSLR